MVGMEARPLIIIDTQHVSGPAKGILQFLDHTKIARECFVIAGFAYRGRSTGFLDLAEQLGLNVLRLPTASRWDWSCARTLEEQTRRANCNFVQTHSLRAHIFGAWLARRLRIPWLAFAHGWTAEDIKVRVYNCIERCILRRPDRVVTVTDQIATSLRRSRRRRPIDVIANAVESAKPTEQQIRQSAEIARSSRSSEGNVLICVVGRLSFEKGQDVLLRALADPALLEFDWKLLLVGDGPFRPKLEDMVDRLSLRDRVVFAGHVENPAAFMLASDIVCLPSRSEGVPNVVLEAANLGKAIISSKVGSVSSMFRDDEARIVESDDVPLLTSALRTLVASKSERDRLGRAGRAALGRWPSPAERSRRIEAVYGALLTTVETRR